MLEYKRFYAYAIISVRIRKSPAATEDFVANIRNMDDFIWSSGIYNIIFIYNKKGSGTETSFWTKAQLESQ